MHESAVHWIVSLLRERHVPFLICGGLAARGFGSNRVLNDIDLFVPGEYFSEVVEAGQCYISKPAARRVEEGWDLTYVQFEYQGIKVEVGNAEGVKIFDASQASWTALNIDFTRKIELILLGLKLPLMLAEDLVWYKSVLCRPVDLEDIQAIIKSKWV
ncbi:hypothetical protein OLMES_1651 [Oleiphilus messinensis]|uniref:Nucleotidyltransferase family protein n=1 Tax=Oleiphilus messinensis TaxID=141451 RepID=A0A1Y0I7H7_9GAMM|nr:hypothetical protein [Oleiphilus messinensis]ARU55726.1 hypothetical protein OLMES_1651 [Oleiphilus messinensis]